MVVCGLSVLLKRLVLVLSTFSVVFGTTDVISNVAGIVDVSVVTTVWLLVVEEFGKDEMEEVSVASVVAIGLDVDDDILCDDVVTVINDVVSSLSVVDGNVRLVVCCVDASLVVVMVVSVVDTDCVVNKEDNESPLQEMFSATSDSISTQ